MYEAIDQTDVVNPNVAVKCVDIRKTLRCSAASNFSTRDVGYFAAVLNEIVVLSGLSNDHVVRYISCWAEAEGTEKLDRFQLQAYVDSLLLNSASSTGLMWVPPSNIYIKMELCQFTLKYFLENHQLIPNFANGHVAAIFKDIATGLSYIHSKGFIHRDIKPGNIFCKVHPICGCIWKMGDLGLATRDLDKTFGQVGTDCYRSPEMKRGFGYTTKADMWSLGLVFLELVQQDGNGFNVAQVSEKLHNLGISRHRYLYLKEAVVQERFAIWVKVINKLVNPDEMKRISSTELEVALNRIYY